ncbi:MAG: histidine triad nucleotide-binding protein [Rickettsiales bacterium]|nr:histidine triad nucleotide-binding protein [Rickettsiales bacterium]|tara:strand:- start:700 stop:1068 length:369 start_codon:yes stop_codon:yes gene_type:complete
MIDIVNYDKSNIFAKILRKEIPSKKVFENEYVFAFEDINPQAPIHILVIPKKPFCSFSDFSKKADTKFIFEFMRSINLIVEKLELKEGYRLITNIGKYGGQEVPHFHFHLLSGKPIGKMVST